MGIRGSRPNPSRGVISEPELIIDVAGVIASARQKGYIADCNTNIEAIIKDHNIDIVMEDMNSAQSGTLAYNNGKWTMRINQKHHPRRRRFTMAHEFAHYYLHREATPYFEDTTFFRNDNVSSIEFAANDFASKLLMPEEDVKTCISDGTSSLSELAKKFNVSIDAMRKRITNLGYKLQNDE